MNKDDLCITKNYTIMETIEAINNSCNRGVIVLNDENKVCGFVSQGDILEALLQGRSVYASVSNILKPDFIYSKDSDLRDILPLFKKYLITVVPIIDDEYVLKDVVTLYDVMEKVSI